MHFHQFRMLIVASASIQSFVGPGRKGCNRHDALLSIIPILLGPVLHNLIAEVFRTYLPCISGRCLRPFGCGHARWYTVIQS